MHERNKLQNNSRIIEKMDLRLCRAKEIWDIRNRLRLWHFQREILNRLLIVAQIRVLTTFQIMMESWSTDHESHNLFFNPYILGAKNVAAPNVLFSCVARKGVSTRQLLVMNWLGCYLIAIHYKNKNLWISISTNTL